MAPTTRPLTALEQEIGSILLGLRTRARLDQNELGLNRAVYARIERGERHADLSQLDTIAAAIIATERTDLRDVTDLIGRAEASLRYRTDPGRAKPRRSAPR